MPSLRSRLTWWFAAGLLWPALIGPRARAEGKAEAAERFRADVAPVLEDHCYGCHGDGLKKGGVALDAFPSDAALVSTAQQTDRYLAG